MIDIWGPKVTTLLKAIEGVKGVYQYDNLPPTMGMSPAIIWLPTMAPEFSYGLSAPSILIWQIQVTLYLNAALLPEGVGQAVPFIPKVMRAFANDMQLDGIVNYILPRADGPAWEGPASLTYGGNGVFTGVNFYYDVKENWNDLVVNP